MSTWWRIVRLRLGLLLLQAGLRLGDAETPDVPRRPDLDGDRPMGWWCISGESLLEALYDAHHGDHPDVVYAELYVNSDHTDYGEDAA